MRKQENFDDIVVKVINNTFTNTASTIFKQREEILVLKKLLKGAGIIAEENAEYIEAIDPKNLELKQSSKNKKEA